MTKKFNNKNISKFYYENIKKIKRLYLKIMKMLFNYNFIS